MRLTILLLAAGAVTLLPAQPADEDTVLWYDSGVTGTWWCSDRDSSGAGVKFTPGEYPCEVLGSRAEINYDDGRQIYLRVWDDDGPGGLPGTLCCDEQRLDVPPSRTPGLRDYLLTAPVRFDSGDFYIVFWQKNVWDLVFSSDEAMNHPERQWWFFPDQGWVTPYGMDASDHMIRALVRYGGTGVVEELGPAPRPVLSIVPNPAKAGRVELSCGAGFSGPLAIAVSDAAGRTVAAWRSVAADRGGSATLDLTGFAPGTYFVRVAGPGGAVLGRLVVAR